MKKKLFAMFAVLILAALPLAAATNITLAYTSQSTFTITLASLSSSTTAARQSTQINNATLCPTSTACVDVLILVKLKTGASGVTNTGFVNFYVCGSIDGGTTVTEGCGASDAAITLTAPANTIPIGSCNAVANATTYICGPFSVAKAFGGVMPDSFSLIVNNQSAAALDSTGGSFAAQYKGVYYVAN